VSRRGLLRSLTAAGVGVAAVSAVAAAPRAASAKELAASKIGKKEAHYKRQYAQESAMKKGLSPTSSPDEFAAESKLGVSKVSEEHAKKSFEQDAKMGLKADFGAPSSGGFLPIWLDLSTGDSVQGMLDTGRSRDLSGDGTKATLEIELTGEMTLALGKLDKAKVDPSSGEGPSFVATYGDAYDHVLAGKILTVVGEYSRFDLAGKATRMVATLTVLPS
jgi:hypothetical protein